MRLKPIARSRSFVARTPHSLWRALTRAKRLVSCRSFSSSLSKQTAPEDKAVAAAEEEKEEDEGPPNAGDNEDAKAEFVGREEVHGGKSQRGGGAGGGRAKEEEGEEDETGQEAGEAKGRRVARHTAT